MSRALRQWLHCVGTDLPVASETYVALAAARRALRHSCHHHHPTPSDDRHIGYRPSAIGYRLLPIGHRPSVGDIARFHRPFPPRSLIRVLLKSYFLIDTVVRLFYPHLCPGLADLGAGDVDSEIEESLLPHTTTQQTHVRHTPLEPPPVTLKRRSFTTASPRVLSRYPGQRYHQIPPIPSRPACVPSVSGLLTSEEKTE
jgi:hypothetical protein